MKKLEFKGNKNLIHFQLKQIRSKKKITQEELAAKMQVLSVNINQQEISRIEHNRRVVSDFELVCFCKALSCTERELLRDFYEELGEDD